MQFDLVIRDGNVVTATEEVFCDIGIEGGTITAIGKKLPAGEREIDANGDYVFPGGIDAHTHIEQISSTGIMCADDFYTGTVSAAHGGTTTVLSFAAQHKGDSLKDVITDYHTRAKAKAVIDYSFHLILSDPTESVMKDELPELIRNGYTSFKVYMTYDRLIVDDSQMLDILTVAKKHGALTMIHAENNAMIKWMSGKLIDGGHGAPRYHALSHPRTAESEAINRAIALAGFLDAPILIVHVSTEAGARIIAKARYDGRKVFGETCPQYMFLNAEQMDLPGMHGAKLCCSPPLRDRASQEEIWRCLQNGTFQVYSSDHAPYKFDETGKLHAGPDAEFPKIANGLPGIEMRLPLLFSEGFMKGRITLNHFVALAAANVSKIYGLEHCKGSITEGKDADIAIWDPEESRVVTADDMHDNMEYTPYEGMQITGWPTTVIQRGKVVVDDNELHVERGAGEFVPRKTIDTTGMPGRLAPELDPSKNFGVEFGL